jgi:DNA-binding CsgD family transcriptional regulator
MIDIYEAVEMKLNGMTYQQIADHYGITKQNAWAKISPIIKDLRRQKHA